MNAPDLEAPVGVDAHLHRGGHAGALLDAAGDPQPVARSPPRAPPAQTIGCSPEHGRQALVAEVPQAEREWVEAERAGQLVHVRLACEVVGRRGQGAVRPLWQRGVGRLVVEPLVRNLVRADEAEDLTRGHRDVEAVHGGQLAEAAGEIAGFDNRLHDSFPKLGLL